MRIVVTLMFALIAACSSKKTSGGNCPAGQVEQDGNCVQLCSGSLGCPNGTCCTAGLCVAGTSCAPEIESVNGTGITDGALGHAGNHLVDRLIIDGQNLLGATATLTPAAGGPAQGLELCAASSSTQITAAVPDNVTPGNYTLTVSNQAGACSTTLPLIEGQQGPAGSPDTGAQILSKLAAVDGTGSGLDADTLDGMDAAQVADSLTGANILSKLAPVDGAASGLDADKLDGQEPTDLVPVGTLVPFAGNASAVPSGWLLCDGRAVSRTTYAALFGVLGIRFGGGDGVNTFNLPNLGDDRFPMGVPNGRVAEVGGDNAIPTDGSHVHGFGQGGPDCAPDASGDASCAFTIAAGDHNHGGDKRPRYVGVLYIIRER